MKVSVSYGFNPKPRLLRSRTANGFTTETWMNSDGSITYLGWFAEFPGDRRRAG